MTDQKFTGERFVPGYGGAQLAYEHVHRYLYALRWARGKRVLDVACGTGYGAGLLAKTARQVWAIDIDGPAVLQARRALQDPNICFVNADGSRLPIRAGTMDLIVAFEVIEHVPEQEGMIRELARVLKPGGLALISTPDKAVYSDARNYVNPFHFREFYRDEFVELLHSGFPLVRLLEQQVRAGSLISGGESPGLVRPILTGPLPGEGRGETASMYFFACCSIGNGEPPAEDSVYLDPADSLFREWRQREIDAGAEIDRLNQEIARLGRWARDLDAQVAQRDKTIGDMARELNFRDETILSLQAEQETEVGKRDQIIRDLQTTLERETSRRDEEILRLQGEFALRTAWAQSLEEEVRTRDDRLRRTNAALEAASDHLARIRHAFLYRVLCRAGILPK